MFEWLKNKMNKRGMVTLGNVPSIIITLVLIGAVAIGGFLAFDGMSADLVANSYAANATDKIEAGVDNVFDQFGTIGTIVGVAILLGFIFVGFAVYQKNRGGLV